MSLVYSVPVTLYILVITLNYAKLHATNPEPNLNPNTKSKYIYY